MEYLKIDEKIKKILKKSRKKQKKPKINKEKK